MKVYKYFSEITIGQVFILNEVPSVKCSSRTLRHLETDKIFYASYWEVVEIIDWTQLTGWDLKNYILKYDPLNVLTERKK